MADYSWSSPSPPRARFQECLEKEEFIGSSRSEIRYFECVFTCSFTLWEQDAEEKAMAPRLTLSPSLVSVSLSRPSAAPPLLIPEPTAQALW